MQVEITRFLHMSTVAKRSFQHTIKVGKKVDLCMKHGARVRKAQKVHYATGLNGIPCTSKK